MPINTHKIVTLPILNGQYQAGWNTSKRPNSGTPKKQTFLHSMDFS